MANLLNITESEKLPSEWRQAENETLQEYIRRTLAWLVHGNFLSETEIKNLHDKNYCMETFFLEYPLFVDNFEERFVDGDTKYWKDKIGDRFFACKEWWKPKFEKYIPRYEKWLLKVLCNKGSEPSLISRTAAGASAFAPEAGPSHPSIFRGRRIRKNPALRALCRQTDPIGKAKLIMPYFVVDGVPGDFRREIPSMPGQFQFAPESLAEHMAKYVDLGLATVLLFGIPAAKDEKASGAYAAGGIVQKTVELLKKRFPGLLIMTDVCLCEYMSHGHCGILNPGGVVDNDATLPLLVKTAVSHAEAGADFVAPSDMMDGRVAAIRQGLDAAGFSGLPLVSYAVKYASAYYGPFREAAESAPAFGDRKSYQMDPGNSREALLEARADLAEGADMLIVKPAGPYQDIIRLVRQNVEVPLAAYQVSGEYALIRAAARNGWVDGEAVMLESLMGIKRAGADILITYFTEQMLENGCAV